LRAGIVLDLTFQAGAALTMTMSMSTDSGICQFETALGACGVRWSGAGIVAVLMPKDRALAGVPCVDLAGELPEAVGEAIAGIVALLDGESVDLRAIELDESVLDPFRRRVYAIAREIAPGATVSYGEIAAAIGEPNAAREVGAALGRNPFPIIVPCHRVLAATGALHGFSAPGGIATKRRMLEIELAPGFRQQALFG
jgi:methylated-DNA-[protein]-cysteine S-methyltransferase